MSSPAISVLFEAVPNVSEGRRAEVMDGLAAAAGPDVLLDLHADPVHNRSVLSLAGFAATIEARLLALVAEAAARIDLTRHSGVHPRVGAADVVPVVPLEGSLEEAAEVARRTGRRIHLELGLPVYFYGRALGGASLADIRAGRVAPDLGAPATGPAGAVCVGARPPLVAYNVLLPGAAPEPAWRLARGLRATAATGMRGVQALAFPASGGMQLSMNLFDLDAATPETVLAEVRLRCARLGLIAGPDEVVGLCPAACALPSAAGRILETHLAATAWRRLAPGRAGGPIAHASRLLDAARSALDAAHLVGTDGGADAEARAMLRFAIRGLRDALSFPDKEVLERYAVERGYTAF